jgi:hypothetical protein
MVWIRGRFSRPVLSNFGKISLVMLYLLRDNAFYESEVPMTFSTANLFRTLSMAGMMLSLWLAPSALAQSSLEGKITSSFKATGLFDLRVEIWDNRTVKPTLIQSIEIPRVSVDQGRFKVSLTTSLANVSGEKFSVKIQSRLFESWKPFQPAELSLLRPT